MKLYASPYDISKHGFYFEDMDEYEDRYKNAYKRFGTEEYEIDFIDGTDEEAAIFKAAGVNQANVGDFFETIDELEDYELVSLYYLMEQMGYKLPDARSKVEDMPVREGTAKDYVEEGIDEELFSKEVLLNYIDTAALARDMGFNGEIDEFVFAGTTYTADPRDA